MRSDRNKPDHECSEEAERLRRFLSQKDLDRSFQLEVLSHAAGLDWCDAELREKLNGVLEELKACGQIRAYEYKGMTYWIRK